MTDEYKKQIFDVVTKGWPGSSLLFPYKGHKNILITPEHIMRVLEEAIIEAEKC